ncbi:Conserved_hypothetical protein [Hexamita inflata]|uniref:Uncharacterized protein n=1 Tax=Hexamita inflata TaxID=28002 RepID=A0AA86NIW3_9EUKA|nr:Conserved hypothetical protein [Hexamita inflata]
MNADKYAEATTDSGFKHLFSDLEVAKAIINCVVPDFLFDKITTLTLQSTVSPRIEDPLNKTIKQTFMDYYATTEKGESIVIEMQSRRHIMFDERALFYAASTFVGQMQIQKDQISTQKNTDKLPSQQLEWYERLKKVYTIQFIDYDSNLITGIKSQTKIEDSMIKRIKDHQMKDDQFIKHYVFYDKNGSGQEIDTLQLIQIEFPRADKIKNLSKQMQNQIVQFTDQDWWLSVLELSGTYDSTKFENAPPIVKQGLSKLKLSVWLPQEIIEYTKELISIRQFETVLEAAEAVGEARGVEQTNKLYAVKSIKSCFDLYVKHKIVASNLLDKRVNIAFIKKVLQNQRTSDKTNFIRKLTQELNIAEKQKENCFIYDNEFEYLVKQACETLE